MDDFDIVKVIGRGSFGKVYLVKKKSCGSFYAMKTLKKDMILKKGQTENTKGNVL
jgi:serine/threonine protein kinase